MGPYSGTSEELQHSLEHRGRDYDKGQWQRWDEELVAEFGRWLGRLAKVSAILFLGVLTAVVLGWF